MTERDFTNELKLKATPTVGFINNFIVIIIVVIGA